MDNKNTVSKPMGRSGGKGDCAFSLCFENHSFRLEAADFEKEGMNKYYVDKIESFEIIRKLSLSECKQYLKNKE